MRSLNQSCILAFILFLSLPFFGQTSRRVASRQNLIQSFATQPLSFEQNRGQADVNVRFVSRAAGYSVYLSRSELRLAFDSQDKNQPGAEMVRISLTGVDKPVEPQGTDLLPGVTNYYIGNDPAKWKTNVPQYRQVRYRDVYPGVDLVVYGNRRQLEFNFDVAPGADVSALALKVDGATVKKRKGSLMLRTPLGHVAILKKPELYQGTGSARRRVAGGYLVLKKSEVAFSVGHYDRRQALVIDPALVYSTLAQVGDPQGPLTDFPFAIAVDSGGAAYVTGQTFVNGNYAALVVKFDPLGSTLVYQTFIDGSQPLSSASALTTNAAGFGIAVDTTGNAYVAGMTQESDFPTTNGSYSTAPCNPGLFCLEAFAAKLNASGSLAYSTFLVQDNAVDTAYPVASSVAIDSSGALYVTGATAQAINNLTGLPLTVAGLTTTPGAFQPKRKNDSTAFILKLHPDGSTLDYATYLCGSKSETSGGITVDSTGVAYVDGGTFSSDFPTTTGATNSSTSTFFTKLAADGSSLLYSTLLAGPSGESEGTSIAIDSSKSAYLAGMTAASFPAPTSGLVS